VATSGGGVVIGPDLASIEAATSGIPWDANEFRWQLNRPRALWTPLPAVGDEVAYRNDEWGPVSRARVLELQDPNDMGDHYLFDVVTTTQDDGTGRVPYIDGAGQRVKQRRPDPWLTLTLDTEHNGRRACREARLRGSAGWLPLDWRTRQRPLPRTARLLVAGVL